jgi:hypothetical protein
MNTKTSILLLSLAALSASCVSATASDDATVSQSVDLPAVPAGLPTSVVNGLPAITLDKSVPADISSTLSSLKSVGKVSMAFPVNSLTSSSDMSWLTNVRATIATTDGTLPEATLSDYTVSGDPGDTVNLPIVMDGGTLLQYLSESGGVNLHFYITGDASTIPTDGITLMWTLTAHADISVSKSL